MRNANPLSEILDSVLLKEERLLDTEWPAGDADLLPPPDRLERNYDSAGMRSGLRIRR